MTPPTCPRCRFANRGTARFCGRCGLSLEPGPGGGHAPGTVRDPRPAEAPPGYSPVQDAAQLYARWESEFGGQQLSGTEGLVVEVFNAGYALAQVVLTLRGEGRDHAVVLDRLAEFETLPKGALQRVPVASYELGGPLRVLRVGLRSAEFDRSAVSTDEGG